MAWADEGTYLFSAARKKDAIVSGGENIASGGRDQQEHVHRWRFYTPSMLRRRLSAGHLGRKARSLCEYDPDEKLKK